MINNPLEYERAREELRDLTARLDRLGAAHAPGDKGLAKAGVRKMIARLHEELAVYEGSEELRQSEAREPPAPPVPPEAVHKLVAKDGTGKAACPSDDADREEAKRVHAARELVQLDVRPALGLSKKESLI